MSEQPTAPNPDEVDVVRVTVSGDELRYEVLDYFEGPAGWGQVLADLARVVAQKFHEYQGRDHDATLRAIRDAFDEELNSPLPQGPLNG